MDLDRIAVVLRPRSPWEAVDLGAALLRRFWRPIMAAWCFTVVPACLVILTFFDSWWAGIGVIWLLKPIFDRVPRFVMARALFGAAPTLGETLRRVPRLWTRDLLHGLIALRLQASRALTAPVSDLEGLRGRERTERATGIKRGVSVASNVAVLCWTIEIALTSACVWLVFMILPTEFQPDFMAWQESGFAPMADSAWIGWLIRGSFLVAFSVAGPLHVACGFALYVNRRTELEGWDIELAFRRCAERSRNQSSSRLGRVGALVLAVVALFVGSSPSRADAAPVREPERVIREVLRDEQFGETETRTEWRLKGWDDDASEPDPPAGAIGSLVALLVTFVGWAALIAALTFVAYHVFKRLGWIALASTVDAALPAPPTELFGLDLRPETLPADVPAAVRDLWRTGQAAAATGLLYRATIAALVERDQLRLVASDTEFDCIRRVRDVAPPARADAFGAVTRAWQTCAYSTALPTDAQIEELCAGWAATFRRAA